MTDAIRHFPPLLGGNRKYRSATAAEAAANKVLRADGTWVVPAAATQLIETSGPTTLSIGAIADGEYLLRSGSTVVGGTPSGGGTPAGSDTEVQLNVSSAFGSSGNFTYNIPTDTLNVGASDARITIDGAGQEATLKGGRGVHIDSAGTSTNIGDIGASGNSTTLTIDDRNARIVATKKIVCDDAVYLFDSGTSTYWRWESISGVWTGTDTGSASLP